MRIRVFYVKKVELFVFEEQSDTNAQTEVALS